MNVPPVAVRRLIIVPSLFGVIVIALGSMPVWAFAATMASRFASGRLRVLRTVWFAFVYLFLEAVALAGLFALWVASGFGRLTATRRFQTLHYRFLGWWLRCVLKSARRTFKITIDVDARTPTASRDRPLIVLARHAGPGDSLLLVDALINGNQRRRPRIVLKDLLQLDPVIDVALNRVPSRFVPSKGRAGPLVIEAIAELSATMDERDALVIFPEGANYTARRREAAIEKLERAGRHDQAERARRMEHLLAPKPGGALAAIEASPFADVMFVAHIGLEDLNTLGDIVHEIPLDTEISAAYWVVEAASIPPPERREDWLYDQWQKIDDWIAGARGAAGPVAEAASVS